MQKARSLSNEILPGIPSPSKKGVNGGRKRKPKNKNGKLQVICLGGNIWLTSSLASEGSAKVNSHGDYEIQISDFAKLAQLIADNEVPVPDSM